MAERRPTLTASAPAGVRNLRSGRKKACGAVEQKKAPKQGRKKSAKKRKKAQKSAKKRKKALAFVAAIRERRNGLQVEQRNKPRPKYQANRVKPAENRPPEPTDAEDATASAHGRLPPKKLTVHELQKHDIFTR
jgi:hypothetical protein